MPDGIPSAKSTYGSPSPVASFSHRLEATFALGTILSTGQGKDKCFADTLGYEPSLHPTVP